MTERIAEHACSWSCSDWFLAVAVGVGLLVIGAAFMGPRDGVR